MSYVDVGSITIDSSPEVNILSPKELVSFGSILDSKWAFVLKISYARIS